MTEQSMETAKAYGPDRRLACLPPLETARFLLLLGRWAMRITSKGQVTIPQEIRKQCGRVLIERSLWKDRPAAKACNGCVGPGCALT